MRAFMMAVVIAGAGLASAPAAVNAAVDTTPPSLRLDPAAHYKVGSQVDFVNDPGDGTYWQVAYYLKWKATDPSGICSQTLTEQSYDMMGGDADPVLGENTGTIPIASTARTYDFSTDESDWERGPDRYVVRSTDCAGNTATSGIATTHWGLVDDRGDWWWGDGYTGPAPALTFQGNWATSSCTCFANGTTHYTSTAGSSASVTVGAGRPVALMMATGPGRGSVDIYVDGKRTKTVSTYASNNRNRIIVWQGLFGAGQHTIKVVNKATAGRPRMDIDAILL